jgi:hypothetical protein
MPKDRSLVSLIALDSEQGALGAESWAVQSHWLETELSKPQSAHWTVCFAHRPLFSNSAHGDDPALQKEWGTLLKKYKVDFYLAGHDHALEHLQIPDWPTSFIVSGGGGNSTYEIERHDREKFARSEHGFVHMQFTADTVRVSFIDKDAKVLYIFERNRQGDVKVLLGDRTPMREELFGMRDCDGAP